MANCAGVPDSYFEERAAAVTAPAPVYAAFFMGQGGYVFSSGFADIANKASARGIIADVFAYSDVSAAQRCLDRARQNKSKRALIGYSLGCTTATYLQTLMPVDLVICIAESTLGDNHIINKTNTKRSVLYRGTDFLSSAGLHDGFDEVVNVGAGLGIPVLSHLLVPSTQTVVNGVLAELAKLKGN